MMHGAAEMGWQLWRDILETVLIKQWLSFLLQNGCKMQRNLVQLSEGKQSLLQKGGFDFWPFYIKHITLASAQTCSQSQKWLLLPPSSKRPLVPHYVGSHGVIVSKHSWQTGGMTDKDVVRITEVSFYLNLSASGWQPTCRDRLCQLPGLDHMLWANLSLVLGGSGVLPVSALYMYTKPKRQHGGNVDLDDCHVSQRVDSMLIVAN